MKNKLAYMVLFILLQGTVVFAQDAAILSGVVLSATDRQPLPGANILLKGTTKGTVTDQEGRFSLPVRPGDETIEVSYLGFNKAEINLKFPPGEGILVLLQPDQVTLSAVEVVSTGYQELPRERASGSFVQIGQELVDRRISTNLLDRLKDITPGLVFNRSNAGNDPISIRGRNTIFANTMPLVIIDNFPYDGPLENINPNDVESMTILRDAAAASIWGARAGNGVIVITTKKGSRAQAPKVSLNANVIGTESPDLFYVPQMASADFIGVERMLFGRGFYNSSETSVNRTPLSPVVETLIAQRNGQITAAEAEARIAAYGEQDLRSDLMRYYYRPSVSQQYALNISGGGQRNRYVFSAGYDNSRENIVGNSRSRLTLNAQNTWDLIGDRLELNAGLYYAGSGSLTATELPTGYIYDFLADADGNPLPLTRGYSRRFVEGPLLDGLLDWNYVPLDEIGTLDNTLRQADLRVTAGLSYKILPSLKAGISHQYWQNNTTGRNLRPADSFFARDLVNQFSQREDNGRITRNIPEGGIFDLSGANAHSHNFRAQINYEKSFSEAGQLNLLAGYEIKSLESESNRTRYYGYDDAIGVSRVVNYTTQFRRFHNGSLTSIPQNDGHTGTADRFLSWFANGSYVWKHKYVLNASIRRDASNLFGVRTNQRAVPLWSVGASWVISGEGFAAATGMPFLRLRGSYGYSGNVDRSVSAFTTAQYLLTSTIAAVPNLPYANLRNPPNPDLRWERIGILNFGLDLETKDGRIRTNLEYYIKNGTDLIGDFPVASSNGLTQFRGNFADSRTEGIDLEISSTNTKGRIIWGTRLIFSTVNERITNYKRVFPVNNYLQSGLGAIPVEGKPLYQLYSIPFAGLHPANGNPQSYLNGEPSDNFAGIMSALTVDGLLYHGPSRPRVFGGIMNNLAWKNLSLSLNITYRMGYYFRRQTVNYGELLAGRVSHPDYADRWQQPGDELTTNVPSMPATNNNNRNTITAFGSNLVEKGDHIRLQDIRVSYLFSRSDIPKLPFHRAELYSFVDNIGILWKATKDRLDPDFQAMRPPLGIALGLRVDF